MHAFHIRYRNTQGTLMRILNAASRRALDMPYVQASPTGHEHTATLLLDVNAKQIGQLCRDWHAIVDVTDVRVASAERPRGPEYGLDFVHPFPAASTGIRNTSASAARA